jgi:hypothetical protein
MTIQEAIKSGKPFRRKSARPKHWICGMNKNGWCNTDYETKAYAIPRKDILATDWEIKEK